ncbi:MAG TPA: DUF5591 domain-containing protein, partial [Methanomicrobiales archaeon]|nr:DUF5591 domain-containing protein [Methanomicrobiales archaeon]
MEAIFPSLADRAFSNVPLYAGKGFVESYHTPGSEEPFSIHPLSDEDIQSGSVVMVSNWHTALDNPRQYVEWLVDLKSRLPADTVWYAPATATPGNVHMLLYSGFDLFDYRAVDLCTARNHFCIPEGTFSSEAMDRAGCCCPGCVEGDLWAHNRWVLRQAIATATLFIEQGRLRELVEARCRLYPSQVAILRHLDARGEFLGRYTPVVRASPLLAATEDSIRRVEVQRFSERLIHRYQKPPRYDLAVLLPCSAKKPYSLSQSHRRFLSAMAGRGHALIVTSPLGLVPRELEGVYPAAHYDVPVTGYWDREELAFAASTIEG